MVGGALPEKHGVGPGVGRGGAEDRPVGLLGHALGRAPGHGPSFQ